MLRKFGFILSLLVIVALVAPMASAQEVVIAPDGELVIGVAAALSGEGLTPLGEDIVRGPELVLVSRPTVKIGDAEFAIALDAQDDVCSAEGGQAVANRYVSDERVAAVVGPMCSSACKAAAPIFDQAGYTSVSPSCTDPTLTESDFGSFNRTVPTDAFQGKIDAEFIYNVLGVTRIATIHDGSPYGEGLVGVVSLAFEELGGEVVASDAVNVGDTDFRGLLDEIATEDPELVFFAGFIAEGVRLANQRFDVGLDEALFMGTDGIFAGAFIEDAGGAAEGIFVSSPQPSSDLYAAFRESYTEEFGFEPTGPYHANSADALNVILDAIEAVGTVDDDGNLVIDRVELNAAIRSTEGYEGLIGEITCDETGECATSAINVYVVQDGEFVLAQNVLLDE